MPFIIQFSRAIVLSLCLFACRQSEAQAPTNAIQDTGNVGIFTTSPQTALQIGSFLNTNNYKLQLPGVYNFEQVNLGQYGNGNSALEFINHQSYTQSYGIKMGTNVDSYGPGFYIAAAAVASSYSALSYGTPAIFVTSGNSVGIGTTTPVDKLHIDPGGPGGIFIGNPNGLSGGYTNLNIGLSSYTNGYASIQCVGATGSAWGNIILNNAGGAVAIGTTNPQGYLFAVNGSAICTKMVVKSNASWPDYAFDKKYSLLPLDSLSCYIDLNKHLPDIPSSAQIEQDGLDLGAMEKLHMQKIEELTLYAIDADKHAKEQDTTLSLQQALAALLQKQVQMQQQQLEIQQQQLLTLQRKMDRLEQQMKIIEEAP
jgi:hypothetical protein